MIVVDDEPGVFEQERVSRLKTPDRRASGGHVQISGSADAGTVNNTRHGLDARQVINNSMDLGLICSVLKPEKSEDSEFQNRVVHASGSADIVCLDWEICGEKGNMASRIIRGILETDGKMNGRVRLIAIYTGDTTNRIILDKVFKEIPETIRRKQELKKDNLSIRGKFGIRIVCLFKAHGIQLPVSRRSHQVKESDLPKRLQEEFAELSEGLLSNVALATIASIREMTHHVLARFSGDLDGPWIHHRALIARAGDRKDAEEYAVNIVLSEIKSAINIQKVGNDFAGADAVACRIREMAGNSDSLKLAKGQKSWDLDLGAVIAFAEDGQLEKIQGQNEGLTKRIVTENFCTLFENEVDPCRNMDRFASLTGVRAYPGCSLSLSDWVPILGLGSIIRRLCKEHEEYLLCLQASCDSVRIQESSKFIFVTLNKDEERSLSR